MPIIKSTSQAARVDRIRRKLDASMTLPEVEPPRIRHDLAAFERNSDVQAHCADVGDEVGPALHPAERQR